MPPILVKAPKNAIRSALSYIWGNTAGKEGYTQTVSDAIIVMRQSGLRYQWVKHCTLKTWKSKNATSKMNLIHGKAYATLVTSTGQM